MAIAALIVAGGRGTRASTAGDAAPKQYRAIGGIPMLRRTLGIFAGHPEITTLCAVIHPDDEAMFHDTMAGFGHEVAAVHGGYTRQQSVLNGLRTLSSHPPRDVLIHDAARPFATSALVARAVAALGEAEAVLPVLPVRDTVKRLAGGAVAATLDRTDLALAQTPQGFRFEAILAAHERAAAAGETAFTDDAAIAEWAGIAVVPVEGESGNVKITTNEDFDAAERRLAADALLRLGDTRTGQGFDVHAFAPGGHVMLCGVAVPHERGLTGHSDADVGLHALTDAILGALADGDIGSHFPPSDERWRGAASHIFLKHAADLVARRGGVIAHADVTLICEAPKVGPHRDAMRTRIAEILGIAADRVSVKATTTERLGFAGRREGIAAQAVATIRLPWPAFADQGRNA